MNRLKREIKGNAVIFTIIAATITMCASDRFSQIGNPDIVCPGDYHLSWYFPISMYASVVIFGLYFLAESLMRKKKNPFEIVVAMLFLFANTLSLLYLLMHDTIFPFIAYIFVWRMSVYGIILGVAGVWLVVGLLRILQKHYKDVD